MWQVLLLVIAWLRSVLKMITCHALLIRSLQWFLDTALEKFVLGVKDVLSLTLNILGEFLVAKRKRKETS